MKLQIEQVKKFVEYINSFLDLITNYHIEITRPNAGKWTLLYKISGHQPISLDENIIKNINVDQLDEKELQKIPDIDSDDYAPFKFSDIFEKIRDIFSLGITLKQKDDVEVLSIYYDVNFCFSRVFFVTIHSKIENKFKNPVMEQLVNIVGIVILYIYGVDYLFTDKNSQNMWINLEFQHNTNYSNMLITDIINDECGSDYMFYNINFWLQLRQLNNQDMIDYLDRQLLKINQSNLNPIFVGLKNSLLLYPRSSIRRQPLITGNINVNWIETRYVIHRNPRQLTRLSGPIQFDYINVFNKSLLFIGEHHDQQSLCRYDPLNPQTGYFEVHDWLRQIIKLSDHCIDLFVEDYYTIGGIKNKYASTIKSLKHYESPLVAIFDIFNDCTTTSKHCFDGKLRYHYIDLRQLQMNNLFEEINEYPPTQILFDVQKFRGFIPDHYDRSEYRHLLEYSIGVDNSTQTATLYEQFINQIVAKEGVTLKHDWVYYRHMRKIIVDLIQKEANKMNPKIDKNRFFDILCDVTIDITPKNYNGIAAIEQDAYLLTRLFVVFDSNKMARGPKYCQNEKSRQINHAIVYTGSKHTQCYVNFIEKYFGIKPQLSLVKNKNQDCLTFPQPFDFFKDTF